MSTSFEEGLAHHQAGRIQEAAAAYQAQLAREPRHADALHMLGIAAYQGGDLDTAREAINRAVAARFQFPEAHGNLGTVLQSAGLLAEAEAALRIAISQAPATAAFHFNLGNLLTEQRRWDEARAAYTEALRLDPRSAETQSNLGRVLREQDDLDGAVSAFAQAVALKPDYAEARYNLANAYRDQGRLTQAETEMRAALSLRPGHAKTLNSLGVILSDQGRATDAVQVFAEAVAADPTSAAFGSNWLSAQQYIPGITSAGLFAAHKQWAAAHVADIVPMTHATPTRHKPLVVGFVSPDFGVHPVGILSVRMFEALDKSRIRSVVFSTRPEHLEDAVSARIKTVADWRCVADWSDEALATSIGFHGVDILFDMSGHTAGHRLKLFARKPAPVQITWLGYVGTTGLTAIDWLLTDLRQTPADFPGQHTEGLLHQAGCYTVFDPPSEAPDVGPLPAQANGFVTFGLLTNPAKINADVIASAAAILNRVPRSRLLMKFKGLGDAGVQTRIRSALAAHGIDATRVLISGGASRATFLGAYNDVDIVLDTFPYSGGLTTCEALWMGAPVVTFRGATFAGCHAATYLGNVGLDSLIAQDRAGYEALAADLARDVDRLAGLRESLRRRVTTGLCDGDAFTEHFTAALEHIWDGHCRARGVN